MQNFFISIRSFFFNVRDVLIIIQPGLKLTSWKAHACLKLTIKPRLARKSAFLSLLFWEKTHAVSSQMYLTFTCAAFMIGNKSKKTKCLPRKYILKYFSVMKWYTIIC